MTTKQLIRLTDARGYSLYSKKILEIDHELNGVYYGEVLGDVYDTRGHYSKEMQELENNHFIGRMDENDNALVYRHN